MRYQSASPFSSAGGQKGLNRLVGCVGLFASAAFATSPDRSFPYLGQSASGRPVIVLEGGAAKLTVDLAGGSIVNFHLKNHELNPLVWGDNDKSSTPRAMGHFLCLDRWGAPSEAEGKNGMPFHGEASQVTWEVLQPPTAQNGHVAAAMGATLPMAGLNIKRKILLSGDSAAFAVTEQVTNVNRLGRIFNMVQHPTIGPPFLDASTVVDSDAGKGLMQSSPLPNPEAIPVLWPAALKKGKKVDLRHLTTDPDPNVVSFTINQDTGWVTACNSGKGLLIGYVWKTSDYPWFSAWRHVENGKPRARGLEFGTTGLHQPFPTLVVKGRIFGRPLFEYLDAGQTKTKSYICFLLRIPQDYKGVSKLEFNADRIVVHERDSSPRRDLSVQAHFQGFMR